MTKRLLCAAAIVVALALTTGCSSLRCCVLCYDSLDPGRQAATPSATTPAIPVRAPAPMRH